MISETGFWNIDGAKFEHEHAFDGSLATALVDLASKKSIKKSYDFGCGSGNYVRQFRSAGIETSGFDGNPITKTLPNCSVQDLTDEHFSIEPVDFLLCLEVCEHVPKQFEEQLLKNIDKHVNPNGTLVLSWAIVGQGGFGHVNCQNNDYVKAKFESMGYAFDEENSLILRRNSRLSWFKNTILVFHKKV